MPKDGASRRVAHGITYGSDPRQQLDVYAPRDGATDRPVIVFFYGGSWQSGRRQDYVFAGRALAARGFVVIVPDYRLVTQIRFPAFVQDGAAAVRWARRNATRFGGDGGRIVLTGHSAGAYIAAMLAVDPQWLGTDRAAVRGLVGLAGPYDFLPFDGPVSRDAFGQWPRPAETQPVTFAGAGDPPALLLHGGEDRTVRPANSLSLARSLRAAGVDARAEMLPGIGHASIVTALARPLRWRTPVLERTAEFARQVAQE
jgi:acetyl esterase/lipase